MNNLQFFQTLPFIQALKLFFENLKVPVSYIDDKPAKPKDILGEYYNLKKDGHELMDDVYVIGMVDDAAFTAIKWMCQLFIRVLPTSCYTTSIL